MKNEIKLQTDVLSDLRSFGKYCECFKIEKTSDNGIPDIFFTTRFTGPILIETKRIKGEVRKLQEIKIKNLNKCGTKAFICDSWKKWMDIKSIIGLNKNIMLF